MADLKTNYKDRLLDTSVNTERKFNLVDSDGNVIVSGVSLKDITQYSQTGDTFGAADINKITAKINEQNNSLGGFTPVIDDTGKITGYKTTKGGADTVFPFSSDFQSLVDSGKIKTASRAVSIRYKENNSGASGSVSFSEFNKIIGVVKVTNENYDRILCITNVSGNTVSYKQGYSPSGSDFWASSTITVIGY